MAIVCFLNTTCDIIISFVSCIAGYALSWLCMVGIFNAVGMSFVAIFR